MGRLEDLVRMLKSLYNNEVRTRITNTSDQTDAKSFSEAYKNARSQGYKTFVWNGRHYSTDYSGKHHKKYEEEVKSGRAAKWEETYPNFTHPELRKAKQEELDTYGITNEQTRDRTRLNNNFLKTVSYTKGYKNPIGVAINTIIGNVSKDRKNDDSYNGDTYIDEHKNNVNYLFGVPQQKEILKISNYKQPKGSEDYYYTYSNRNPTEETAGSPFAKPIPIKDLIKDIQENWKNRIRYNEKLYSELSKKKLSQMNSLVDKWDLLQMDEIPSGNYIIPVDFSMGQYTLGVTPEYKSYGDKWDLNPGRSGNDKSIITIGTPFHLYDRFYKNDTPNIDSLYESKSYLNK